MMNAKGEKKIRHPGPGVEDVRREQALPMQNESVVPIFRERSAMCMAVIQPENNAPREDEKKQSCRDIVRVLFILFIN
jgi:hypothetical protein